MTQVFFFHGGDSFSSYEEYLEDLKNKEIDYQRLFKKGRWSQKLAENLPGVDVLYPSMPNSSNAKYDEWKILFEKLVPFFGDDVRLVGHSLGAMFLAKYLQENPLSKKVQQVHLVAGGFSGLEYGSFTLNSCDKLFDSAEEIFIYHSKDDFVVPFTELAYFKRELPGAIFCEFKDRNHFLDEDFPEILDNLKK